MSNKRLDTRLEAKGAEFLVLGQLLVHKIAAYKTYTNMPGYDIVATNPSTNSAARIQVKSRWATGASGFLIKNFSCDFVVVVKLNRGSKDGRKKMLPQEFYVFPVALLNSTRRTKRWGKIVFKDILNPNTYLEKWNLISEFMG